MSVAALSTAGFSQYISATSNVGASQQAFQALQQSLASGNLSAAQSAFNTYNQLNKSTAPAGSSSGSQLSTDMAALGTALGSGNLTTAQSAFATVESDLKSSPSQAVTNAESAVTQTVQWVDDLLSLSSSISASAAPVDPTTAILNAAYGQNASSTGTGSATSTDPTTSILDSAYGNGSSSGTGSTAASSTSSASATPASAASSGNSGSAASVNVYA
jgi:hypothetical protein